LLSTGKGAIIILASDVMSWLDGAQAPVDRAGDD
jgi:hypothetical protein